MNDVFHSSCQLQVDVSCLPVIVICTNRAGIHVFLSARVVAQQGAAAAPAVPRIPVPHINQALEFRVKVDQVLAQRYA